MERSKHFRNRNRRNRLTRQLRWEPAVQPRQMAMKARPCKALADYEPVLHPDSVLVLSVYGL